MEFLLFMLFSIVEMIGIFALTLYVFRFNLMNSVVPVLISVTLMNVQSYLIREDTTLSYIVPVLNLIFIILFVWAILRQPFVGSIFVGTIGVVAGGLLQSLLIYLSNGYLSVEEVQTVAIKGYYLQTLTGFIAFAIGATLYKFGIGFSFDLEKLRIKKERFFLPIIIVLLILGLGVLMYFLDVYINLLTFVIALLFFLYYSVKKEVE
ncbi:hypothetical protein [Paenibacillus xanthanilyticus]|uniref:Uncharacterized protein n=1 Tax=Paenibacillus xanthanilyticus TaxID=1783531 RepID=A0ABV8KB04_9BACL